MIGPKVRKHQSPREREIHTSIKSAAARNSETDNEGHGQMSLQGIGERNTHKMRWPSSRDEEGTEARPSALGTIGQVSTRTDGAEADGKKSDVSSSDEEQLLACIR